MGRIRRPYLAAVSVVGIGLLGASVGMVAATSIRIIDLLLIVLTVLTGWLRVDLDPHGYIDLTPFALFVALLLVGPSITLLAATSSAFVSSRFFVRSSWPDVAVEIGEQGIAALAAVIPVIWTGFTFGVSFSGNSGKALSTFLLVMVAYAGARLILAILRSNLVEGISASSFVRGAGKYMIVHVVVLGFAALGLTFLYNNVGYLALPLATIALVEFYYPAKLIGEQKRTLFASLAMIAEAIDLKDPYTATHSHNVETIAVRVARTMRLPETEVRRIRIGALLHDIGKIGVSGKIIRKPSALDAEEQAKMRQHPVISAEIMQPVELLSEAAEIVRHHHEHYDGSGYPDGLKGEDIPIGSRIILVADAFNAMTSDRPYRRGRSRDEAIRVLREHAGRQFDSKVVKVFESIIALV